MNNKKENKEFQETRMELSKFICNRDNYIPIVLIKWATRGMLNITVSGKSGAGAGAVLSAITDGIKTVMIRKYDAAASMTINRAIRNLTTSTELNPSELEVLQKTDIIIHMDMYIDAYHSAFIGGVPAILRYADIAEVSHESSTDEKNVIINPEYHLCHCYYDKEYDLKTNSYNDKYVLDNNFSKKMLDKIRKNCSEKDMEELDMEREKMLQRQKGKEVVGAEVWKENILKYFPW